MKETKCNKKYNIQLIYLMNPNDLTWGKDGIARVKRKYGKHKRIAYKIYVL